MNHTEKQPDVLHYVKKGFTLVEMMVVIAIISILLTALVPAMNAYMTNSRLNTANSNAKLLFNSLQTICQEYEFSDRPLKTSSFYGYSNSGTIVLSSEDGSEGIHALITGGDFAGDPTAVPVVPALPDPIPQLTDASDTSSLQSRLLRLFEDEESNYWVAVIEGYQVRATFCATAGGSDYVGAYPIKTSEKNGIADILHTTDELTLENMTHYDAGTNVLSVDSVALVRYVNEGWNITISIS